MTRGELGYSEVLEDFQNAEYIYILTYNISKDDETLLEKINESPPDTEIKLYTNIPSRFNRYYYEWAKTKAKVQIDNYKEKLNPENFNQKFQSMFTFDNHSKIIMTNNIAYVGSANYSSESANNFEAGVIFEDKNMINQIINIIEEEVESASEPYYAYNIFRLIFLARELEELITVVHENIWGVWDFQGREQMEYYLGTNINLDTNFIDAFNNFQFDFQSAANDLISEIENDASQKKITFEQHRLIENITYVRDLICNYKVSSEIIEFIEFDENGFIQEKMEENIMYMTEDVLDEYIQNFVQNAYEIKDDLATDAQEYLVAYESLLVKAAQLTMETVGDLKIYINNKIDNT
ncbi:phospholipase D-like domain-containing protein [Exiguobacterium sp. TDN 0502]|uniref:phospholipase D-like domain-containing protein n=1 Tax=Exiguobacterium sp. TDN 0502 TaxID=3420731 RepID=UPI003D778035